MKKYLLTALSFLLPIVSLAIEGGDTGQSTIPNPLKESFRNVPCFINAILEVVVQIGSIILVVFIVLTGLKFVMAKGNETKLTEAKEALFWTIIGAAIVLGAFTISEAIEGTVRQLSDPGVFPTNSAEPCEPINE